MNKITIFGRLTKDVEFGATTSGVPSARFSVASRGAGKTADGEPVVDFIDCKAYRTVAELAHRHLKKGDQVVVYGSMQSYTYKEKKCWECLVDNLDLVFAPKPESAGSGFISRPRKPELVEVDDDDIPF